MVKSLFNEIIGRPELLHNTDNQNYMRDLAARYPYFELAHTVVAPLTSLAPTLAARPYPSVLLYATCDQQPQIDENEDLAAPFMVLADDGISETLASILVAQGQNEQAKEIYLKLSLKNPEKSRYFVSLIEQL